MKFKRRDTNFVWLSEMFLSFYKEIIDAPCLFILYQFIESSLKMTM